MTKTSCADGAALMSARTAKYIEAMIREGANFDYDQWLKRVREEEDQAKQVLTAITRHNVVAAQVDNPINKSDIRDARPTLGPALISKPALNPRALRWPYRQAKSQTTKTRLRRWLEKVRGAWEDFQASRARDAVYGYLDAVFAIVEHYKVRRRTDRLLRRTFEFADLPFDQNADPFSAVIRCTSDDNLDSKTISKWARALRYVARRKEPDIVLQTFMKESGGVNACADKYTRLKRHSNGRNLSINGEICTVIPPVAWSTTCELSGTKLGLRTQTAMRSRKQP
jgi:hypothetical protein